jgi:energy-coupling factor transport system ATP-binding protein
MILFEHVCYSYDPGSPTLEELSFHIEKGEFVALTGENGAGKSTVSKLLGGLLKPDSGKVAVAGLDTALTKTSALARHIGFLFQNPDRQLCQNTVRKEIGFGLELAKKKREDIDARVGQVLEEFGFDGDRDPFTLSRGERQRVALASVLASEPEILVLDEPTTGLDYTECMHVMNAVRAQNERGVTVVMVCHDMEVVLDFARRLLVLSRGRLVGDGKTAEIFRDEAVMERASLMPPQLTSLALRLGGAFECADTVSEMLAAIDSRRGQR